MKQYIFTVHEIFSSVYTVDAESEEEAKQTLFDGVLDPICGPNYVELDSIVKVDVEEFDEE